MKNRILQIAAMLTIIVHANGLVVKISDSDLIRMKTRNKALAGTIDRLIENKVQTVRFNELADQLQATYADMQAHDHQNLIAKK